MKLKKHSKKHNPGAGFVLYKPTELGEKIIVLIKPSGKFDLPKGRTDSGDVDYFATAQRECFEETGIFVSKSDLICSEHYQDDKLVMFCANTNQEPAISKNPESGELEHIAYILVEPEQACKILPNYLANAVRWSMTKQRSHT